MEQKDIVKQIQDIKQTKKITYQMILDAMTENGVPALSLSTLRRVFTCDDEKRASKFNYEETLLPIMNALKRIDGVTDSEQDNAQEEIKALKVIIDLQDKEIDRKNKMIERLINRLDQKDEIIRMMLEKCL